MSDDEIIVCQHCDKPIEDGQPWHTLAEMHYDCYESKFGKVVPRDPLPALDLAPKTPVFEGVKLARANGGHLVHVVVGDTGRALCGHSPANTSHIMRMRGKWNFLPDGWTPSGGVRLCAKCDIKKPEPAETADLQSVIERCVDR